MKSNTRLLDKLSKFREKNLSQNKFICERSEVCPNCPHLEQLKKNELIERINNKDDYNVCGYDIVCSGGGCKDCCKRKTPE